MMKNRLTRLPNSFILMEPFNTIQTFPEARPEEPNPLAQLRIGHLL